MVQFSGTTNVNHWPSTQNVSGIGGDLGKSLEVPAANVHVDMQYIGGGFGSKFAADSWGVEAAPSVQSQRRQAGEAVPRPRHGIDDRRQPSVGFRQYQGRGQARTAPSPPGNRSRGPPGGMGGGGMPPIPYVFTDIPNKRLNHTRGGRQCGRRARLARSQSSAGCLPDLLARSRIWRPSCNMDPLELFTRRISATPRAEAIYLAQLERPPS